MKLRALIRSIVEIEKKLHSGLYETTLTGPVEILKI